MFRKLGLLAAAIWFVALSPTVSAATEHMALEARTAPHRAVQAALASATPDVFRCKTQAEYYAYACTNALPSPFDASAFDYGIGGHTSFDGIVSRYEFKFTAPGNTTPYILTWTKQSATDSFCPPATPP